MSGPWERYSAPASSESGPWSKYAAVDASGGGVQDYEPISSRYIGDRELPRDDAAAWVLSRVKNALAPIAGTPRAMADMVKYGANAIGMPHIAGFVNAANPVTAVGQFMPSTENITDAVRPYIPSQNTPGTAGKIFDTGVEAAIGGLALGGGLPSVIPSFIGGVTSETAGQATKDTALEPYARVVGGVAGGGAAAVGQNAIQSGIRGYSNLRGNDVEGTASRIFGRALDRDKMTAEELVRRQRELGPGALPVEAGGENFKGMVRGSIAAPGEARTVVRNALDERLAGSNERTVNALNKNISDKNSLAATVEDLAEERAKAARPQYEAAGIPSRIEVTETTRPGPSVPSSVLDANGKPFMVPGAPVVEKSFNTPIVNSDRINKFLADSKDAQAAIAAARRLPEYKDLPSTSMAMLDKAYKHLEGLEQAAVRAGNGERARDLGIQRRELREALVQANEQYGNALDAFSGPSKLIGAAERGKEWFSKNVDPEVVRREFAAMTPDERQSALIGVRDWTRDIAGRSDRGGAAARVWGGGKPGSSVDLNSARARLKAVLPANEYEALAKAMETEKNAFRAAADIGVGSRTAPMAMEAADNALQAGGPLVDVMTSGPKRALGNVLRSYAERLTSGRTEAVNAKLAEWATMTDPEKVGMVQALANKAMLEEAARKAGRGNALLYGVTSPTINAVSGERR